ncbi:MAG: hypothetical protein WCH93_03440 [Actinomycetota bacterium]
MRSHKAVVGSVVAAALVALLATACFTANLSGSASSPSPIQYGGATGPTGASGVSGSTKKVEFSLKSLDSLGTGFGGGSGFLRDKGTNPAFPYGVKLSFANSLVLGIGGDCNDFSDGPNGPSRVAHSGGQIRQPDFGCGIYSDPRVWFGLVTYSSADPSRYPNQGFQPCNSQYQQWVNESSGFNAPSPRGPVSNKGASTSQPISGFGAVMVYDTNYSKNYDKGDRFGFISICGPYTHLDASGLAAPVPQGCQATLRCPGLLYNYGTCPSFDEISIGGLVPSVAVDEGGPESAFEALLGVCNVRSSGGDLKIGIATRITTTTTVE